MTASKRHVLALTGGVGGAKLALGLTQCLPESQLSFVVNTADDFKHLGLHISPDLDTLMYTLGGVSNTSQGWGIEGESWQVKAQLVQLGGPTWFQLGDKDIATHLLRTQGLAQSESLTHVTQNLFARFNINYPVYPMADGQVSTFVESDEGRLAFQDYFVGKQCIPKISAYSFEGVEQATVSADLKAAIDAAQVLVICPSNPFVSIDPILSVPGLKTLLLARKNAGVPVVMVSPIVNGAAVKGPAAKMMAELGLEVSNKGIADFYQGLATHIVIDESDRADEAYILEQGFNCLVTSTLMKSLDDKTQLAQSVLGFAQ